METRQDDFVRKVLDSRDDAEKLLAAYVGDEKMLPVYSRIMDKNCRSGAVCFNVTAFLLGMVYFVYNKLYLSGFVIFLAGVILPYILPPNTFFMVSVALSLIVGALFFKLYFMRFFRIVRRSGYGELPFDEVLARVKKDGGKDNAAYVIFAVMLAITAAKMYLLSKGADL